MERFNVLCPNCGKLNAGLDLKETLGSYECIECGETVLVKYEGQGLPVFSVEEISRLASVSGFGLIGVPSRDGRV